MMTINKTWILTHSLRMTFCHYEEHMRRNNPVIKRYIPYFLFLLAFTSTCQSKVTDYIPETIKAHPYTTALFSTAALGTTYCAYKHFYGYEPRWDWATIDKNTQVMAFPAGFLWGTASSALQTEGIITADGKTISNSWTAWEDQKNIPNQNRMNNACNHWNHYKTDITLAADLSMNCYRFSIEWSKIEPERGVFDRAAMDHYIDYVKELIAQGLAPMPTLFHHAWPRWLKNGFETTESIEAFTEFALYVFNAFKEANLLEHIPYWLTFNEPAGYALAAYMSGMYPPGKKYCIKLAGTVLKNMLDAHVAVYNAFKAIYPNTQISLAHMMHPIKPYDPVNPADLLLAGLMDYLLNNVTLTYLHTGKFNWAYLINEYNPQAKGTLDFIGINYYSLTLLHNFHEAKRPYELCADGDEGAHGKVIYAEGFYTSLKRTQTLLPNIPIIVTENGCATNNTQIRDLYLKRHLYAMHKAMQEGVDIRGYLVWTLTDCYGWNSGNNSKYGMYYIDRTTNNRILKEGFEYFLNVVYKNRYFALE